MDNNVTRIGLVVPPGNVAMERELAMYLADGIAMNVNRLSRPTPAVTKESLLEMINSVDQAVRDLAMCFPKPEIIIYGCTSGSFVSGPGREGEIAQRITDGVGIKAVTTSSAILMGLQAVGAQVRKQVCDADARIADDDVAVGEDGISRVLAEQGPAHVLAGGEVQRHAADLHGGVEDRRPRGRRTERAARAGG